MDSSNIFHYMNGGGELYLAYGFDHLEVNEYTADQQDTILVEVYVMNTSDDAFGLLSLDWGGEPVTFQSTASVPFKPTVSPPARALYGGGLLRLWADTIYARVMAFRETAESKEAVLSLGQTIAANRKMPGEPELLKVLPKAMSSDWKLRKDRIGYFRSHLVLNSLYYLSHQNIQSRLRGIILMYYSNKYDALVVSTGNKSEIATGYCTLYGDTNGGKNIPGDLYKTQLYQVCEWINRNNEIIPRPIIVKPPSAELKDDQVDEDNLPPYPILDEILQLRIDEGYSPREIIALGKDPDLVHRIERLYTNSEFKRAQLAQTIKVNKKTFGSGRKIPVLKHATY